MISYESEQNILDDFHMKWNKNMFKTLTFRVGGGRNSASFIGGGRGRAAGFFATVGGLWFWRRKPILPQCRLCVVAGCCRQGNVPIFKLGLAVFASTVCVCCGRHRGVVAGWFWRGEAVQQRKLAMVLMVWQLADKNVGSSRDRTKMNELS